MQGAITESLLELCENKDRDALEMLMKIMLNPSDKILETRPSLVAADNAFKYTKDINLALIASFTTVGHVHAPIVEIYEMFNFMDGNMARDSSVRELIANKKKIPGFGNPVIKGYDYERCGILSRYPKVQLYKSLAEETTANILKFSGVLVYDNIAYWIAAYARYLGIKKELSPCLFFIPNSLLILKKQNIWLSQ